MGWSADHGSLDMDPDVARNFEDQRSVFDSLAAGSNPAISTSSGWRRPTTCWPITGSPQTPPPVYENDRGRLAPSLRERQEWFAGLTGADMAAAEEYRLRLWRDVVAAFESHDVLVWPTDPDRSLSP